MHIDIIDQTNQVTKSDIAMLEELITFIAKQEKIHDESEVSLSIVTHDVIKQLNATYRDKNQVTDVLSFPLNENIDTRLPLHLGDIVICLEKTIEQANEYNHSFQRELGFLAVHGFLHLIGYDHDDEISEATMFNKQKQLLDSFGLKRDAHD